VRLLLNPLKLNTRLRWWIVWTLFCSTVINYIDRQTLSVLAPVVMNELRMTHEDYSYVISAYQISYACMWLIGGVFIDVVGTRLGLTLAMIWWSISARAGTFHVLARHLSFQARDGGRLQLARGQQDSSLSVATWGYASWSTMGLTFPSDLFPQDVVATVTGLSGLGAGLVSTVFTLFIGYIVDRLSYYPVFVVAGTLPLLATIVGLALIRTPEKTRVASNQAINRTNNIGVRG
jgi:sugar phosphate permease